MTKNTFFLQLRFHLNIHNCKHSSTYFIFIRIAEGTLGSSNQEQASTGAGREERKVKVVIHGRSAQGDVSCP